MGQQLRKEALVIFPKDSSYELKTIYERNAYDKAVKEIVDFYKECGCTIACFAEDMLAVRLLHNIEGVRWYSAIGVADRKFMHTSVTEYPEGYKELDVDMQYQPYITESMRKYKPRQLAEFKGDEIAYMGDRLSTINKRIRYVVNKALEFRENVVFFEANNNYCTPPKPFIGDGKAILLVNVHVGLKNHYYGGVLLQEDEFKQIVRY